MIVNKLNRGLVAVIAVASAGSAMAQTASDPGTAVFASVTTQVQTYGAAAFALLAVGMGFWVGMKVLKKAINKAT